MPIKVYSGEIKPFIKYNAKAGRWFVGEDELSLPVRLVADFQNLRTGWFRFSEGAAPERVLDPALDNEAPKPGQRFKRGFIVTVLSKQHGALEFSSASFHTLSAIADVFNEWESGDTTKLPIIECNGVTAMKDKAGTNYKPNLKIKQLINRPDELPNVKHEGTSIGGAPAQQPPRHLSGVNFDDEIPF